MEITITEVLQFVEENDVKFIRLAFCDMFGTLKNISVMPDELPRAFREGIPLDASAVHGFPKKEQTDLVLVPDPRTLSVLPWRPAHGRVVRLFCDIRRPDGSPYDGDSRYLLREAAEQAADKGFSCEISPEGEFYLFVQDEAGNPTLTPHDYAGYCDIAPADKGENVRREICLSLEEMGIRPVASHHEQGPGQNEIDYQYANALEAADNVVTFRSAVKTIANRNGLYASFMPMPLPTSSASGLRVNLILRQGGVNLFEKKAPEAAAFAAGLLRRLPEITLFLNPVTNSYARLGEWPALKKVLWSPASRSFPIRIPEKNPCLELRSPDSACNPYLAFALILQAGMEGVQDRLTLSAPGTEDTGAALLPGTLEEALRLAEQSEFIRQALPGDYRTGYLEFKQRELESYYRAEDALSWERARYF